MRIFWLSVFLNVLRASSALENLFLILEIWNLNESEIKKTSKNLTAALASFIVILRNTVTFSAL